MQALRELVLTASLGLVTLLAAHAAAQQPPAAEGTRESSGGVQVTPPPGLGGQPSAAPGSSQPAPPPGGPSSTGNQPAERISFEVDANAVIGSSVRNAEGRDIGRVSRLMFDPHEGRITSIVIGMGGTLGIGEKHFAVPWRAVRLTQDGRRVVVTVDQRLLEQAPRAEGDDRKTAPAASPSTR